MNLLNFLTLLSYVALNVDIILQIRRIYQTKSSHDISLAGLAIRYVAVVIILVKFVTLKDIPLIIGQGLAVVSVSAYLALGIVYYLRRQKLP